MKLLWTRSILILAQLLFAVSHATAEIVVDDFDVPFSFSFSSEMRRPHATQPSIGQLNAFRTSWLNAFLTNPVGQIDADVSRDSALTFRIDQLNPISNFDFEFVALDLSYVFDTVDLSQGHVNDRIIIDVVFLRSSVPLARLDAFINGRGLGHGGHLLNVQANDRPFSLEIPFDPTLFNYEGAYSLSFFIAPVYSTNLNLVDFSMAIDRIRFSPAVPEPPGFFIHLVVGMLGMPAKHRRRRLSN